MAIFPLPPLNFIDDEGTAQGLYPDLLRAFVHEDDWVLEFVPTTWGEGLQALQDETIDLMTTVAFTKERAAIMDYSQEAVADIWGQIFSAPKSRIENMQDLHLKRVGIMYQGINGKNFIQTANALGVTPEIIEYKTHDEVFEAIKQGEILAGVAPQHFGLRHADEYDLVATSIMFSPFSTYFACKKGKNAALLNHIDVHLEQWKSDPNSIYHNRIEYWMGGKAESQGMIPRWLIWVVILGASFSIVLIILNQYLNYQVRMRTQEIELKEKQYRDLVEGANNVIIRIDVTGRVIFINSFGIELFGYSEDEIIGKLITENVVPLVRYPGKDLRSSMDLILGDNAMYGLLENIVHCKAGHKIFMQWSNKTIYADDGSPLELLSIGADISDKKKSQAELIKSTVLINAMLDGIPDALLAIDTEDRIVSANRAFTSILGWTEEEIIGDHPSHLFANPQKYPYELKGREAFLKSNISTPRVFHYQRKNREIFPGETIVVPMYDSENQTRLGHIGIIRDVTEKQSLEEQVRRSQKLEALGVMVGGIAHDFNNILQSIMLFAETALGLTGDKPELESTIQEILKDSHRAKHLIQQVLTFGRNTELELKPVFIQDVIRDALEFERSNFPSTIEIIDELDDECPAVLCDAIQMHQVIINICNNAKQAMTSAEGQFKVQLSRLRTQTPAILAIHEPESEKEYLELCFRDTGIGMDDETRAKVFDPFFTTKDVGEGTGLGLTVVHNIIKNIHGAITVESEAGVGTTFNIWLPTTDQIPKNAKSENKLSDDSFSSPILFVDDELSIRNSLARMLRKKGFTVDIAEDGEQALDIFTNSADKYGLILTDLNMPKMSGVALAEAIRESGSSVSIVLSSGDLSAEEITDYKAKGINGFIQKPWGVGELITYLTKFEEKPDHT